MDPHRGHHHRLFGKRQGLGGVLGSFVPNESTPSAATQGTTTSAVSQNTGSPVGLGGVIGEFTSLVGGVPSVVLPSSGPSPTTTSSTPLMPLSSSSTGSTTSSTSSVHTTSSLPSTISTSITSATPKSTPTLVPSVSDTVYTTYDGTSVVYVTSTLPTTSATAAPPTSFLRNPPLEGGIFTLVGIVVLIIIFVVVTWTLRKRRRSRLERDLATAVTFDPGATDHYYERQENSMEKRRLSGSTAGHGHGYGYGYGMQPAYVPHQEYHGPVGYGQYPMVAYQTPPNPALYRPPSPSASQPAEQGGANLTRKFSDRKPVPPFLPNPAYDPSNTHVSIPARFNQQ